MGAAEPTGASELGWGEEFVSAEWGMLPMSVETQADRAFRALVAGSAGKARWATQNSA